jgi:virginiamycin B lyase
MKNRAKGAWVACVLMGLASLSSAQKPIFHFYNVPMGTDGPIKVGPDGALWFISSPNILRMASSTGAITGEKCVGGNTGVVIADFTAAPLSATKQPAALWFAETDFAGTGPAMASVGRCDISTNPSKVTAYPVPDTDSVASGIAAGPDGALWFTYYTGTAEKVGRIDQSGNMTVYTVSSHPPGRAISGIAAGSDGALWYREAAGIDRITTSGATTFYPTASPPSPLTTGPDGALWFTISGDVNPPAIGRIDTSGNIGYFAVPPGPNDSAQVPAITTGPDGAMWFTYWHGSENGILTTEIGRMDTSGNLTMYPFSSLNHGDFPGGPADITSNADVRGSGDKTGNLSLWFTDGHEINRVSLNPNPAGPNRILQPYPVQLGTSGSNARDASPLCVGGTLGSLVTKPIGGVPTLFILSNNHVMALANQASIGDAIVQPGYEDGCSSTHQVVGHLSQFVSINFSGGSNTVDAAIAQTSKSLVVSNGAILEIGPPSSAIASPSVGMQVMKSGRTTGLTTGTIDAINVTVMINYGAPGWAKFVNQFAVIPGPTFSWHGDSGALIVTANGLNPVGLLFAGSAAETLANPIESVVSALNITFVGGTASPTGLTNTQNFADPKIAAISKVKDRYDDYLLSFPEVIGHGVGYSRSGAGSAVIKLFVRRDGDTVRNMVPSSVDGAPLEVVETGEFHPL